MSYNLDTTQQTLPQSLEFQQSTPSGISREVNAQKPALNNKCIAVLSILGRLLAVRAAVRYLRRRERLEHPEGRTDGGGRWYPAGTEHLNTNTYRSPSRSYPWSYMLACRSVSHCAQLEGGADVTLVRRIVRAIDKAATAEVAVESTRSVLSAARKTARKNKSITAIDASK